MTTADGTRSSARTREGALAVAGCAGLALAVGVRATVTGPYGIGSPRATLVFAMLLVALSGALGLRMPHPTPRAIAVGVIGAALLCAPVLAHIAGPGTWSVPTLQGFPAFAGLCLVVGSAEELLLRGALFDVLTRRYGTTVAVLVTAGAFAGLHVPMYGWHIVPLDVAVGVLLGALRLLAGSVWAPASCHVLADLATWWLR